MKIRNKSIGWDISHLEFTIEDHYYFSTLKSQIKSSRLEVREVQAFQDLRHFDIIVINYPEKSFNNEETEFIYSQVLSGKRVIITGYYNNEDHVSSTVNSLAVHFGVELNRDEIRNYRSNFEGDPLLPVTGNINLYNDSVSSVMLPCSASINVTGRCTVPFILNEDEQIPGKGVMGTITSAGEGEFILVGTCVFWDNNAITKYNNLQFSLNLLT